MPILEEMFKQGKYPEQIVNMLYNTGYRLTGSHKETKELVKGAFDVLNGNADLKAALKSMCLTYMSKTASGLGNDSLKNKNGMMDIDISTNRIQAALLTLPHAERLVLVLREILGLNYDEIAEMTGIERSSITRLLTTGRWNLLKYLNLKKQGDGSPASLIDASKV